MYCETYPVRRSDASRDPRSRLRDASAPQPPAWLLAGEDDEHDNDRPHICRGID